MNELYGVNTNLRTVAEIQRALRAKALDTPPGRWVRGFMFDDTKVVDGPLHRTHLDEAAPDHPVDVAHRGGHTNWFNSTAFALAGITRDTPRPPPTAGSRAAPTAGSRAWWPSTRGTSSPPWVNGRSSPRTSGAPAPARGWPTSRG